MAKGYGFGAAQDWHHYMKIIFKEYGVGRLLEFGLGEGTEYLLDNAGEVTSVEISLGEFNRGWYNRCMEKYSGYKNWEVKYIEAGEGIREGHERITREGRLGGYDGHMAELRKIVDGCGMGWEIGRAHV